MYKIKKPTFNVQQLFFWKLRHLRNNAEKYGRTGQATDESIIWSMLIACWILKATETDSEYVILVALPWQYLLQERGSFLTYTYIACLVAYEIQLIITE